MELESAILEMFANRIEEARSMVKKALEVNTTAMNKCQEGEFDVKPVLLVSHDLLLIAANTLDAIKDYVPHLTLKDEKKSNHEKYTLPPIY